MATTRSQRERMLAEEPQSHECIRNAMAQEQAYLVRLDKWNKDFNDLVRETDDTPETRMLYELQQDNYKAYSATAKKRIKRLDYLINPPKGDNTIDLAELKEILITELFEFEKLKETQSRYYACCPFHQEKEPSFVIYKDTNSFYCFGCNKHGDNISFIQELHGTSFKEALKYLK